MVNANVIWIIIWLVGAVIVFRLRLKIAQDHAFWSTYVFGFVAAVLWPIAVPVLVVLMAINYNSSQF